METRQSLINKKTAADRSPSTVKYGQDPLGQLPESSAQTRHFGLCENLRGDKAVEDGSRRVLPERPARNSHVLRAGMASSAETRQSISGSIISGQMHAGNMYPRMIHRLSSNIISAMLLPVSSFLIVKFALQTL